MMLFSVTIFTFVVLTVGIKILKLLDAAAKPKVYHSNSDFIKDVLSRCKHLMQVYYPPLFWGKSGHIQTIVYAKFGRWNCPSPPGERCMIPLLSGETVSYDVFQPTSQNQFVDCCTILVCPGICNSSEKKYIRTFVQHAVERGFRVFVLNHIGVLPSVKLTSPKIFTYGETKYFAAMVDIAKKQYPDSVMIITGFSMGGNIIARYLGEDPSHQDGIACAVSLCQGYDGIRSARPLSEGYRRIYNYMMTLNFKKILQPHWKDLFHLHESHSHSNCTKLFDEKKVKSARYLHDIEDGLLRHFDGHSSAHDYMSECGCERVIHNISLPFLLINSEDDPIIVKDVHDVPIQYCYQNEKALFVTTKHGGHLGFFKGGWWIPDDVTLIEHYVMEYIEAVLDIMYYKGQVKPSFH